MDNLSLAEEFIINDLDTIGKWMVADELGLGTAVGKNLALFYDGSETLLLPQSGLHQPNPCSTANDGLRAEELLDNLAHVGSASNVSDVGDVEIRFDLQVRRRGMDGLGD